jgi:hypothetical protein
LRSNDESFAAVLERLRAARRKPLFEVAFIATLAILLAVAVQAYAVKP